MMKVTNEVQVRQELKWVKFTLITTLFSAFLYGLFLLWGNFFSSTDSEAGTLSTSVIVNAYAHVDSISGSVLYLSSPDETNDQFEKDEKVLIIQMQDNVLGGDTLNNSSFGTINGIGSAGSYEVLEVASVTRSGGVIQSITFSGSLTKSFSFGANSTVQLVSYPKLGSGGVFTTTSPIEAKNWDGNTGGIVLFEVEGTLQLKHDVTANGAGFRGGASDNGGSGSCVSTAYISAVHQNYGDKGEGIHRSSNQNWAAGRAKIANGGGGGSSHNAGGGGGGNYSAGGDGGQGWSCSSNTHGLGGAKLSTYISADRVYMGGGGGAGEVNNNGNSAGGNGGGMIFIKASKIETVANMGDVKILANGEIGSTVGGDGAGGGGAGGSIVLKVDTFSILASSELEICANGGDGGNVDHAHSHGAGGGGGQGVIYFSSVEPTQNTTIHALNGDGGANNNGNTSFADDGSGVDDGSIFDQEAITLPVSLIYFSATGMENMNSLEWSTSMELNNDFFSIERSNDGVDFTDFHTEDGNGTSNHVIEYSIMDVDPYPVTYYRLSQTDFDGMHEVLGIRVVKRGSKESSVLKVYPNPSTGEYVQIEPPLDERAQGVVTIMDMSGRLVDRIDIDDQMNRTISFNTSELPKGTYIIQWSNGAKTLSEKLIRK